MTPYLEKLIHEGKADFRTYCMGGSGVGTIPCQQGSYIVVLGFIWNPFIDAELLRPDGFGGILGLNNCMHTMRLLSKEKNIMFNFRDSFQLLTNVVGVPLAVAQYPFFNSQIECECYFLAKQAVQVDIWRFLDVQDWHTVISPVPLSTNEPASPNGYGNRNAVRAIETTTDVIFNMGIERDPTAHIVSPRQKDEFFCEIQPPLTLNAPNTENQNDNYSFPIVTFKYVIINELPPNL